VESERQSGVRVPRRAGPKAKKDVSFHLTVAGFFDSARMMAGGNPEEMIIDDAK
jgi:hypothetical protein